MAAGEALFDIRCLGSLAYKLLISWSSTRTTNDGEAHVHTCAGRAHQDHPNRARGRRGWPAGRMVKFVLQLLDPRFELLDQLLQRLHSVVASWSHWEEDELSRT